VVAVRAERAPGRQPALRVQARLPDALRAHAAQEAEALSDGPLGLLGDFNVAPTDADVWDPAVFDGGTHVSVAERAALEALRTGVGRDGLTDLLPRASIDPDDARHPWTFWEMRMLGFQKRRGMRLDLALVNTALAARVTDAWVDRDARRGEAPSDHAPLVLDLD
jgi:exodeoxyribonuclease-3